MKPVAFAAWLLFTLYMNAMAVETNTTTTICTRPEFVGLGLDEFGFPTNLAAAYAKGQADARRDLTNGALCTKTYGLPTPWASSYRTLLEKRCGVKEEGIAGCMVTQGVAKYAEGYDEISYAYIEQKFGTNIFDELESEAQSNWQKARASTIYRVQPGDTLTKIAHKHGVTLKALESVNPNLDGGRLKVGQKISLPPMGKE
jgi:hypothetical protein